MDREILKKRRLQLNMTQQQVADAIHVEKPTYQRYESGVIKRIDTLTLEKLAGALQCSPAYLMGWQDDHAGKTPLTRDFVEKVINEAFSGQEMTQEKLDAILPIIQAVAKSFKRNEAGK